MALLGLLVWNGADRRAADATRPLLRSPEPSSQRELPLTLKIASFNTHSGKGDDGLQDLSRTAATLPDVDFTGLYEVRATPFGDQPNQAAAIAALRESGWLFAPTERHWWIDHFGNGLIHRLPLGSVVRVPLMNTRGKAYRNAILSTITLQNGDVRVLAVHIDREEDRVHQLQTVIDLFLGLQAPCVLMGDLNTVASDPLLLTLLQHADVQSPLHEALGRTPPADNIDWIFTRGLKTLAANLVENAASDHPLLWAELAFPEHRGDSP